MSSLDLILADVKKSVDRLEDKHDRNTERIHERLDEVRDDIVTIKATMPKQPCRDVQEVMKKQHETEERQRIEDTQKSGAFWGVIQKVAGYSITAGLGGAGAWVAMKMGLK